MKITLSKDTICGSVSVPAAEYLVALLSDSQQLLLTGGGKQLKIPAVKRRSGSKSRVTTVSLIPGGGVQLSIVVSTPKFGEWVSLLEIDTGKQSSRSEKK